MTHVSCLGPRIVWLTHETILHPHVVRYPAQAEDVRLVLNLLDFPLARRQRLVGRLRNILSSLEQIPAIEREGIPARYPDGIFRPISWRLAIWLSIALGADGSELERLRTSCQQWLSGGNHNDSIPARELSTQTRKNR